MSTIATINPIPGLIASILVSYLLRLLLVPFFIAYSTAIALAVIPLMTDSTSTAIGTGIFRLLFAPLLLQRGGLDELRNGPVAAEGGEILFAMSVWYVIINILADIVRAVIHRNNPGKHSYFKARYHLAIITVLYVVAAIANYIHNDSEGTGALLFVYILSILTIPLWKLYTVFIRRLSSQYRI